MAMGTTEELLSHALKNNGHRCHCNHPLTFEQLNWTDRDAQPRCTFSCYCERCERRAKNDGHVVFVIGRGDDPDLAFADMLEAVKRAD
jgi:hypothetical protein